MQSVGEDKDEEWENLSSPTWVAIYMGIMYLTTHHFKPFQMLFEIVLYFQPPTFLLWELVGGFLGGRWGEKEGCFVFESPSRMSNIGEWFKWNKAT